MADERIVIHFATEGLPKSQDDIDKLQKKTKKGFAELNAAFELFQKALSGVQTVATGLYSALIDSNERLNAQLADAQTSLASTLDIYRDGTKLVDITERITSTQLVLQQSLKQIEKDTVNLVGVTTDQVNGVFKVLLQNSQKFIGQSKEITDPIEAATASTKNWAAALGTLGLPLEQANQEIRSILQGDVNNPDSIIAKTLQISREQYDQWVANGELIDKLNEKLEVFTVGNALASKSVAGVTSNLQSFFEDTARLAGADLLGPVVDSLNAVYKILVDNRSLIEELAGDNVQELVELFNVLEDTTKGVADALDIDEEGFLKTGSATISAIISATEGLIVLGGGLTELFGPGLTKAFSDTLGVINLSLEGIGKLSSLIGNVTGELAKFTGAINNVLPNLGIDDVLTAAQSGVAQLTGEYGQSIDAVKTYSDITSVLLAQTEKLTSAEKANADQIKGQIEQLKQQKKEISEVKTFRDQDADSIDKQKAAIDKAIVGLEEMAASSEKITLKAREFQDLGTILEDLAAKASSAATTIKSEGSGDATVFNEAVEKLTELIEKQVEYGQITISEAKERLEAILNNNKVELEAREGALNTLKSLEQDYTDFKVGLLDEEIGVLERRAQVGEISAIESAEGQYQAENEQIRIQLDLLDQQIERQEGLGGSTEKLLAERQSLVNESLQLEVNYVEKVGELEKTQLDETYERTVEAARSTEVARTTALQQALLERQVSQSDYDSAVLQATQERLQTELEAEQNNIANIESLLASSGTASQRKELQAELDAARLKSAEIFQQTISTEISLQQQSEAATQEAYDKKAEAARQSYADTISVVEAGEVEQTTAQKQALLAREISKEEYAAKELQITRESLDKQYQAELDNIARLETLLEGALSSDQRVAIQGEIDAARLKSQQLNQAIVSADIDLLDQQEAKAKETAQAQVQALEEQYSATLSTVADREGELTNQLKQSLASRLITQEEYNQRVTEVQQQRLQAELAANQTQQQELAKLIETSTDREGLEKRLNQVRSEAIGLESQLIDIELQGNAQSIQATKEAISEKSRLLGLEYSEKEAQVRATIELETDQQLKLAELNVERVNKQIEAEKKAQAQLASLGDSEGVSESKIKLRELAIDLIDAEISAEESLQGVIEGQLSLLREKLDLKRQSNEVELLEGELELAKAVSDGVLTKEEAEKSKLELTKARVEKEIELLQELEGQGTESEQLKNRQDLLRNQIELEKVEQQILGVGKEQVSTSEAKLETSVSTTKETEKQVTELSEQEKLEIAINAQLEAIQNKHESSSLALDEQVAKLQHIETLNALQNESNQRQVELKNTQLELISAQTSSLSSGLNNELSLVNQSLTVRQRLKTVTDELNKADEIGPEKRLELETEAKALKEQLNALGSTGAKEETELLEQRQVIQQRQLDAEQIRLELSQQTATIEIANQRVLIELDQIKAVNRAKLLELEAESLKLQSDKLRGEAALTEDTAKRTLLLQQANNIDAQVGRTLELSEAQVVAANQEANIRNQILDKQLEVQNIQFSSQQEQLDTQRTILDSQQAYEASVNNLKPNFNNNSLTSYNADLEDLRKRLQEISDTEVNPEIDPTETEGYLEKVQETSDKIKEPIEPSIGTKGVDRLATKIGKVKSDIQAIASGARVPPITIPLNVKPANLDVKVEQDSRLVTILNRLATTVTRQTETVSTISRTTQSIKDNLPSSSTPSGGITPIVKNQVNVSVASGNQSVPKVTVDSIIDQRQQKCSG